MNFPRVSAAVLVVALAAAVVVAVLPGQAVASAVVLTWMMTASGILVWRWRATRGPARLIWGLLAATVCLHTAGDLVYEAYRSFTGEAPALSLADAFYTAEYVPLIAAITLVAWRTGSAAARSSIPEVGAFAVVAVLAAWEFLVVAPGSDPDTPMLERVVFASYPMMDAVLLAVTVWTILAPGRRTAPIWWLAGFAAAFLASDLYYSIIELAGTGDDPISAGSYLVTFGLLAAAALSEPAESVAEPVDVEGDWRAGLGRVVVMAATLAGGMALTLAATLGGLATAPAPFVLAAALVFAVVVARMVRLVIGLEQARATSRDAEEQLTHIATHDALTGLPNRRLLRDRLENALARARRSRTGVGVLFLDLDRFKAVNDALGHRAGDRLLAQAGARITGAVRDGDTVARLGGDEFVVVCPDLPGAFEAGTIAERIIEAVSRPYELEGFEAQVGTSVGIAITADGEVEPADLLRDADRALYEAKQSGRGCHRVYDARLQAQVVERRERERLVRRSLEAGDIHLVFAPEVSLETGASVRARAGLRFAMPDGGVAEGAEVVGIAESVGLGARLLEQMLTEAAVAAERWNRLPLAAGEVGVAVEVSTRQFSQPTMRGALLAALEASGLEPRLLTIRVTEDLLLVDPELAARRLAEIAAVGARTGVEGVGTGKASLGYIDRFPVDEVVVAPEMLSGVGEDRQATSLMAGLVLVARACGLEVVAAGVTTEAEASALAAVGCAAGRGPYFGAELVGEATGARLQADVRPAVGSSPG